MKIVIDMNLSPLWLADISQAGFEVIHWKDIGFQNAPDSEILDWARANNAALLSQDLDFNQILFRTSASGPSVVLLRLNNELDPEQRNAVCNALSRVRENLEAGAVVVIDHNRVRVRRLPL